jgi:hypothetical protein
MAFNYKAIEQVKKAAVKLSADKNEAVKLKSTLGAPGDAGLAARNYPNDQGMSNFIDIQKDFAKRLLEKQIKALESGKKEDAVSIGKDRAQVENMLTSPTTLDMARRAMHYQPRGVYSVPTSNFALPMPKNIEDELYGLPKARLSK